MNEIANSQQDAAPKLLSEGGSVVAHSTSLSQAKSSKEPFSILHSPLAEPWPEAVEGGALLDEITSLLRRYVVLPADAAEALALWTVHTYAFHLRDVTAYVGIESPEKRCGKTTLLDLLSLLVNRAVVASNISPSAIYRVIEEVRPTLIIDEADTFFQGNEELRGILNAGYTRKAAFVVRVDMSSGKKADGGLASFSCWCPKIMAAIGRLPDTLADRCIIVRMQRKLPSETCERMRRLDTDDLCRRCARWVQDHQEHLTAAQPPLPAELHDRAADIWEPLLAVADLAGGAWPQRARQAALNLAATTEDTGTIGSLVVEILKAFDRAQADRMLSRHLVLALNFGDLSSLTQAPARRSVFESGCGNKPITELWLANTLRPYGVRPLNRRVGDQVGRGYAKADFLDMFRRYVPFAQMKEMFNKEPEKISVANAQMDADNGKDGGSKAGQDQQAAKEPQKE